MFFDRCYFCVSMLAALLESIVFHVLSSPRGAETIFVPFYCHRAAREQYFCHFIVAVQRGNNIFAFYRHRAARKQYFRVSSFAALLQALKLLFSLLRNGDRCWNGRGGAYVPARTSAQRRFHTKNTRIVCGGGTMDAPLRGARAGTQAPPLPRLSNRQQTPTPF